MAERLLHPSYIPQTLWQAERQALIFPHVLSESYRSVLSQTGMLELAISNVQTGDVGGESAGASLSHFCSAFSGSCARFKLAMLDPNCELGNCSDVLLTAFSGGRLAMLDIPCGAGAVACSALTSIAELRANSILPRHPLDVYLVAGEISDEARDLAGKMYSAVKERLRNQAIFLHEHLVEWDACSDISTTQLLYRWMQHATDCHEHLVVIANFSAFLQSQNKFKEARLQFSEIFRWANCRNSSVIWVEPQTNQAKKGLFIRLRDVFGRLFTLFHPKQSNEPFTAEASAHYQHPLRPVDYPRVNLAVLRLEKNNA